MMNVAVVQMASGPEKKSNIARAFALSTEALEQKAGLVLPAGVFLFPGSVKVR